MLPLAWLGVYINSDEIEKNLRDQGVLAVGAFEVMATNEELHEFLRHSSLLRSARLLKQAAQLQLVDGKIHVGSVSVNSCLASVLADFIRHKLLQTQTSCTFETVMSSPDKVLF